MGFSGNLFFFGKILVEKTTTMKSCINTLQLSFLRIVEMGYVVI